MALSYNQLAILAHHRVDYDTAETFYHRSLETFERLGDQAGLALNYHKLGGLALDREDYDTAETLYRRALEIFERLGDQAGTGASYHQLGVLAHLRADYSTAETFYSQALGIFERLGNQANMAASYSALARLSEALGNPERAVVCRVAALVIRLKMGVPATAYVQATADLRRGLGRERFRAALPRQGLVKVGVTVRDRSSWWHWVGFAAGRLGVPEVGDCARALSGAGAGLPATRSSRGRMCLIWGHGPC